jgi:hypothetical protein
MPASPQTALVQRVEPNPCTRNLGCRLVTIGREETLALLKSLTAGASTAHQEHTPEIDHNRDEARMLRAVQDGVKFHNGR